MYSRLHLQIFLGQPVGISKHIHIDHQPITNTDESYIIIEDTDCNKCGSHDRV